MKMAVSLTAMRKSFRFRKILKNSSSLLTYVFDQRIFDHARTELEAIAVEDMPLETANDEQLADDDEAGDDESPEEAQGL